MIIVDTRVMITIIKFTKLVAISIILVHHILYNYTLQ